MPVGDRFDFFLSRRGSVAAAAREVAGVLTGRGHKVVVLDYDIPTATNSVEAIGNARDLLVLFTRDYAESLQTRKEFTSFAAERARSAEERRVVVLRCEDVPLRGLFAADAYQDLAGIDDPEERRRRILAAAEGRPRALPPPPRPFVGVPPRIRNFTGRGAELDRIDAILTGGRAAAVTGVSAAGEAEGDAVQDVGGVGKTSLAIEYAYRYRDLYAGVWWCPAETRIGLLTSLAALAREPGAAVAGEKDIEKAAKAGLGQLAEQRATFLLVFDNVASPEAIADLLPNSGARVLLTSRSGDWGGFADEVALDVLPAAEASAFLEDRAGRQDPEGAAVLAEALGRLPLALEHAAAYCKRTQADFSAYAVMAEKLIAAAPRGASYPRSIAATFELAIAETAAGCPAAEALMACLAQCAPERVPRKLVEGVLEDEEERAAALAALADVSLLRHDPFEDGTLGVAVHRLVQAAGRARATARGAAATAAERVLSRLAKSYPADGYNNPASWPLCAQLTPHLLAQCGPGAASGAGTKEQAQLLGRAVDYFFGRAAYSHALPLLERTLAIRERALGHDHPDTVGSVDTLARPLPAQGDLAGARALIERAPAIAAAARGPGRAVGRFWGTVIIVLGAGAVLLQWLGPPRAVAPPRPAGGAPHPLAATPLPPPAPVPKAPPVRLAFATPPRPLRPMPPSLLVAPPAAIPLQPTAPGALVAAPAPPPVAKVPQVELVLATAPLPLPRSRLPPPLVMPPPPAAPSPMAPHTLAAAPAPLPAAQPREPPVHFALAQPPVPPPKTPPKTPVAQLAFATLAPLLRRPLPSPSPSPAAASPPSEQQYSVRLAPKPESQAFLQPLPLPAPRRFVPAPLASHLQSARPALRYLVMGNMSYGGPSQGTTAAAPGSPGRWLNLAYNHPAMRVALPADFSIQGDIGPDWRAELTQWVNGRIYSPEPTIESDRHGAVVIRLIIARDGSVRDVALLQSSGMPLLDSAWLALFQGARLPPFPSGSPADQIAVEATLR